MAYSKEERVHHVFEKIYRNYDTMNAVISFDRHKRWRKDVMKQMSVKQGEHALDVCCGTGDWSLTLSKKVGPEGRVVGIDFSHNMLSIAKEKQKHTFPMKQLEFMHGNAMDLPFSDDSFDIVTIGFGLRNVPDYMTVLKELYRVVKPGGQVVCLETSQPTLFGYRQLYHFYFRFIMPLMGRLLAKSYEEYAWLNESTKHFPDKRTLKRMFEQVGFKQVEIKSYDGGVAAMHRGTKLERNKIDYNS